MSRLASCNCITLLLLMALLLLPLSAGAAEAVVGPKTALVAVIPADFPPTCFLDQNGQPAGLVLSICSRLTQMMGGTLEVASTSGKGSCFNLTLTLKLFRNGPVETACNNRQKREQTV
jgi:ABC-type amino acid transport substrate-binding protein